ncbi:MAG: carboxylating nicotinate-nucleotide diphosphorylase [candidate division Zixibacteria bacterium]|nr:carboxylating nicotinate-nucleotide diphosphorylase [candidate division Zixibacteria bacterium]
MTNHLFNLILYFMRKDNTNILKRIVSLALKEDLGKGDVTSNLIISKEQKGEGVIISKEKGVIAGLELAKIVFKQVDPELAFKSYVKDGTEVKLNQQLCSVKGRVKSILSAERTALNFLQRLSGITTLTREYMKKIKGTKVKILDTRKTTPALRTLEKYAVRAGGGENHRHGLYDMILIKDNHIKSAGSISSAIELALKGKKRFKIEIETKNLNEVREVLNYRINRIMLDNFNLKDLKKAVRLIRSKDKKVEIEASGQVNLKNVKDFALCGMDFISIGALTHSAKAIDISLILK